MALQIFGVDDANPAHAYAVGMSYNGTDTLTATSNIVATDFTTTGVLSISGTQHITGNLAVNTNRFTVSASSGNTTVFGNVAVNTDKFFLNGSNGAATWGSHTDGDFVTEAGITAAGNIESNPSRVIGQELQALTATFHAYVSMSNKHAFGATSHGIQAGVFAANLTQLFEVWSTSTGNCTIQLADGAPGQLKVIAHSDRVAPHNINIQPAHLAGASVISLDTAHSHAFLLFSGGFWRIIYTNGTLM